MPPQSTDDTGDIGSKSQRREEELSKKISTELMSFLIDENDSNLRIVCFQVFQFAIFRFTSINSINQFLLYYNFLFIIQIDSFLKTIKCLNYNLQLLILSNHDY